MVFALQIECVSLLQVKVTSGGIFRKLFVLKYTKQQSFSKKSCQSDGLVCPCIAIINQEESIICLCVIINDSFLNVRNRSESISPLLGTYCEPLLPNPIFSKNNELFLHLKNDSTTSSDGYEIIWTSSPSGKTFVFHRTSNVIGKNVRGLMEDRQLEVNMFFLSICTPDYFLIKIGIFNNERFSSSLLFLIIPLYYYILKNTCLRKSIDQVGRLKNSFIHSELQLNNQIYVLYLCMCKRLYA